MERKISRARYVIVFFLTAIIFSLGIFIGGTLEELRVKSLYLSLQEQDVEYNDVLTERYFIEHLVNQAKKNIDCNFLMEAYRNSIRHLDTAREKLDSYMDSSFIKQKQYEMIKGRYADMQINYWLLFKKIKSLCPSDSYSILYFYKEGKDCPKCEDQGVHLMYVKQKLKGKVMVFSLDADRSGPNALLVDRYHIFNREYPVLIINDSVHGYMTNEQIFSLLCKMGLNESLCNK
jgi:thiol-disulfide isomerase/thioredoxin